jgi:integrase
MARTLHQLTARRVDTIKAPGYYPDGDGLYLRVAPGGTKAWIYRYTIGGRTRDCGLGSYPAVSLAAAREEAVRCRQLRSAGLDPIEERKKQRAAAFGAEKPLTFRECAEAYIASHEASWSHPKHRQQWRNTLATYVYPVIGNLPAREVDTDLIMKVLEPIWRSTNETARRVRMRIEAVLDWARVKENRQSDANPARLRGQLDQLLPRKQKAVQHRPALPYADVPALMSKLRKVERIAARALEFGILTATRSSEFREAAWADIDMKARVWTTRVKITNANNGSKFRVVLSEAAVAVLEQMPHVSRLGGVLLRSGAGSA